MKFNLQKQLIIMIDFDLTICHSNYPDLGELFEYSKEVITKWFNQGAYIIINTCRSGRAELEAEAYLLQHKIPFHKINGQHPNGLIEFGTPDQITHKLDTRKIHGHLNIDDTNLEWAVNGFPSWYQIDILVQKYITNLGENNKYNILPNTNYNYINE